jgi:hypothetical protein
VNTSRAPRFELEVTDLDRMQSARCSVGRGAPGTLLQIRGNEGRVPTGERARVDGLR